MIEETQHIADRAALPAFFAPLDETFLGGIFGFGFGRLKKFETVISQEARILFIYKPSDPDRCQSEEAQKEVSLIG